MRQFLARSTFVALLLLCSLTGMSEAAIKGSVVTYPPVPLTHATDCTTGITTAYQDQMCVDLDDGKIWICKTPGAGGATDVAGNPLCNQPSEWQSVAPAAGGYTQIQDEGLAVTGRTALNFGGAGVSCVDNAGQARTDCTIAGGGASGNEKIPAVSAATTGNISNLTNPGTATFDGTTLAVTTPRQRLLVWQQTTASQNGIYDFNGSGVALTRSPDADQDAEFTTNFQVFNQATTGTYAQRTFRLANTGAVAIGSSNITFTIASYGPGTEVLANKNATSGYMGLVNGRGPWNRMTLPAIHPNLTATSTIDILSLNGGTGANVIGIQNNAAGNVILTTANPRINGCTLGNDRVIIRLVGLSTTQTVTIPNGQGVLLAGAGGSVTIGIAPGGGPAEFICNGATTTWEQFGGGSAQQAFSANPNVLIYTCGDARNPIWDGGGGTKWEFCIDGSNNPTIKAFCGGGACDSTVQLAVGKVHRVKKHDGSDLLTVTNDTGTVSGSFTKPFMAGSDNGSSTCSSGGDTWYFHPAGRQPSQTITNAAQLMPAAYTLSNFHMGLVNALDSGQTAVFTLMKNGVATGITCSIIAGASTGTGEVGTSTDKVCEDVIHTVNVVAQDLVTIQSVCSGGSVGIGFISYATQYQ